MKQLIVTLVLIGGAFTAPLQVQNEQVISNATRNVVGSPVGFASINGGTRGGAGGTVFTVWDAWALRDALDSDQPRIVYLRGRHDLTALFVGSPGIILHVGSFTSLIGGDNNAEIFGGGVRALGTHNVIIQNIKFNNAISYAAGEQPNGNGGILSMAPGDYSIVDAVTIDQAENVWVDHCEFSDDPWVAATAPQRRHDGLVDIIRGSNWVTISNNIFRNHNLVTLVGSSDNLANLDAGKLKVTFFANWYRGTNSRNPRARFGEVHILNNLFTDITDYIIGVGYQVSIYSERNTFVNCRTNRASQVAGTPGGNFIDERSTFRSCSLGTNVPNSVRWNPMNYYNYRAIARGDVENYVRNNSGTF